MLSIRKKGEVSVNHLLIGDPETPVLSAAEVSSG